MLDPKDFVGIANTLNAFLDDKNERYDEGDLTLIKDGVFLSSTRENCSREAERIFHELCAKPFYYRGINFMAGIPNRGRTQRVEQLLDPSVPYDSRYVDGPGALLVKPMSLRLSSA